MANAPTPTKMFMSDSRMAAPCIEYRRSLYHMKLAGEISPCRPQAYRGATLASATAPDDSVRRVAEMAGDRVDGCGQLKCGTGSSHPSMKVGARVGVDPAPACCRGREGAV